ncbi:MAG: type II toxin-antitoxin system Phd/YefM family antitoxin [Gemmatimonadota bacterium]
MRTIGIRELKAHLSSALREVQRGELYLVTDRGRVVAELRPPGSQASTPLAPVDLGRRRLIDAGELRVSEMPRSPYRRRGVKLPEGASRELIDWVRGDG